MARHNGLDTPRIKGRTLRPNYDPETFGRLSESFARFLGIARLRLVQHRIGAAGGLRRDAEALDVHAVFRDPCRQQRGLGFVVHLEGPADVGVGDGRRRHQGREELADRAALVRRGAHQRHLRVVPVEDAAPKLRRHGFGRAQDPGLRDHRRVGAGNARGLRGRRGLLRA